MNSAFIHGFVLAFGLILPLGVQNVFVLSQGAIQHRFIKVIPVIITASLSDTLLISIAVFGVSVIVLTISWVKVALVVVGILFLAYMGWVTWISNGGVGQTNREQAWPVKRQIAFALSTSLLNPHAIMDTVGVIGTSSLSYNGSDRFLFAFATILVSWVWFTLLAIIGRFMGSVDKTGMVITLFNKASAVIMWGSGIYLLNQLW